MFTVPILMIVFNRPDKTKRVLQALEKIKPARIFVAADGPRLNIADDAENSLAVRKLFDNLAWPCEVHRLFQSQNLGVALNPRKGLTWFFHHVEEGIILEDDCVPGEDFFPYCRELLAYYRTDARVFTINGGNLGYELTNGNSYTFTRFMNMTGWATWRRSFLMIDYDLKGWCKTKQPLFYVYSYLRQHLFDFDINWYKYWRLRFDLSIDAEKTKWWDYHWIYNQLVNKKVSIVPCRNLVTNIGFDDTATSVTDSNNPAANVPVNKMIFPLKHPTSIKVDMKYEENIVKEKWCSYKRLPFIFYIKMYVSKLAGRMQRTSKQVIKK